MINAYRILSVLDIEGAFEVMCDMIESLGTCGVPLLPTKYGKRSEIACAALCRYGEMGEEKMSCRL